MPYDPRISARIKEFGDSAALSSCILFFGACWKLTDDRTGDQWVLFFLFGLGLAFLTLSCAFHRLARRYERRRRKR